MVTSPAGLGPENDCAGQDQQKLQTTYPFSHLNGCYTVTTSTSVQFENKFTGREFQGSYRQDELIDSKP
jgi:hypothetical protein